MSAIRPEDTARILMARYAREDEQSQLRAERLKEQVRRAVPEVARRLGARRVYLFGSLVWGPVFPDSDVDLAVEGLTGAADDAFAAALWKTVEAPIDVVSLERAADSLRERVLAEGMLVFAADESG